MVLVLLNYMPWILGNIAVDGSSCSLRLLAWRKYLWFCNFISNLSEDDIEDEEAWEPRDIRQAVQDIRGAVKKFRSSYFVLFYILLLWKNKILILAFYILQLFWSSKNYFRRQGRSKAYKDRSKTDTNFPWHWNEVLNCLRGSKV